jgi:hypothetical protein
LKPVVFDAGISTSGIPESLQNRGHVERLSVCCRFAAPETSWLWSQKSLTSQLASIANRNALACLHLRDTLSNGVPVLLTAQGLHGAAMRVTVNEDVRQLRIGIYDLDFAAARGAESLGQFFAQICTHAFNHTGRSRTVKRRKKPTDCNRWACFSISLNSREVAHGLVAGENRKYEPVSTLASTTAAFVFQGT